jgi:hypothetical protein
VRKKKKKERKKREQTKTFAKAKSFRFTDFEGSLCSLLPYR